MPHKPESVRHSIKNAEETEGEGASQDFDLFGEPVALPTIPRTVRRLVDAGAEIMQDPPERAEFFHAILCQVGMPRRQTSERLFERSSGTAMLRLEAGVLFNGKKFVEQPLPYGAKPRLIMVHVGSEAVRTRSREIEVGNSAHDFMQRLGFDTNARGYSMVKKQIMALGACRMTLGLTAGNRARTVNTQPIEQFEAWISNTGAQRALWPGSITLSETFFNTTLEFAVPLDSRALGALKHSALAIDIYTWLAHRLCRIHQIEGVSVSWANLKNQFGQEYASSRDFKKEFKQALLQVHAVYPDARLEYFPGGLKLLSSPPPIRKTQILLPSSVKKIV